MTESDIHRIVDLYRSGLGARNIARVVGQREDYVRDILRGRIWRSVTGGRLMNGKRPFSQLRSGNQPVESEHV